jgi:anti-sigma regulatory factor (Ser/Thr protein kinase)
VPELRLELEPTAATVPRARAAFRDRFAGALADERLETATLLLSELVTNSVLHAGLARTQRVTLLATLRDGRLHAEVCDGGSSFERRVTGPAHERGGWGLYLVERLADRWGVNREHATCVWFELAAAAA